MQPVDSDVLPMRVTTVTIVGCCAVFLYALDGPLLLERIRKVLSPHYGLPAILYMFGIALVASVAAISPHDAPVLNH